MDLGKIQQEHSLKDRKHPRPVVICDGCGGDLILCWGEKISLHLRHKIKPKDKGKLKHKPKSESYEHKFAKNLLIDYLNSGGRCEFIHTCGKKQQLPEGLIYKPEIAYKSSRFDIAGFDKNDDFISVIEICHTHKTDNTKDRNRFIFVEVQALEVCDKLDLQTKPDSIVLQDFAQDRKCCMNLDENNPIDKIKVLTQECKINTAIELGYLCFKAYTRPEIYRKAAVQGLICERYIWHITPLPFIENEQLWDFFLSYHQCLFCDRTWNVSKGNPYCHDCYFEIKEGYIEKIFEMQITFDNKMLLRRKMSWLKYVEEYRNGNDLCQFCNYLIWNKKFQSVIWWFGQHKKVCWDCFDRQLTHDHVYDIDIGY